MRGGIPGSQQNRGKTLSAVPEDLSQCTFVPIKAEELRKQFISKLPLNPLASIKIKLHNVEKLVENEK